MGLPDAFMGPAKVSRVTPVEGKARLIALRFGERLVQNMEFAVFIEHLQNVSRTMSTM